MAVHSKNQPGSLYAEDGARKYLNRDERRRALAVMAKLPAGQALFCLTLAWTGARVSEALALRPSSFQIESSRVSIRTLKRRKPHVREVPIPPELMAALDRHFHLSARQCNPHDAKTRLWPMHRSTAWTIVKGALARTGIIGRHACPKGLRHSFGVSALRFVPVTLLKKWLGHARLSTTEIYLDVSGDDEIAFAVPFWHSAEDLPPAPIFIRHETHVVAS